MYNVTPKVYTSLAVVITVSVSITLSNASGSVSSSASRLSISGGKYPIVPQVPLLPSSTTAPPKSASTMSGRLCRL